MTHTDTLAWLEAWYVSQVDGDWEHICGVRIDTLDNPGWSIEVDLAGTYWQGISEAQTSEHRSEHDWFITEVKENVYRAWCGPKNLAEALDKFRSWIGSRTSPQPLD